MKKEQTMNFIENLKEMKIKVSDEEYALFNELNEYQKNIKPVVREYPKEIHIAVAKALLYMAEQGIKPEDITG